MLVAGTRLGPYEVTHPLGAGGMGEVYAARDTRLDRPVAIKILPPHLSANPDFRMRFEREARVISGLNHSHICTLYDVGETMLEGETSAVSYLVMEYCEGQTLAERIAKGPLPIEQVVRYGAQIAAALDRAHRAGIVHRDLKPGNVILTKAGAKLLDFGLAKPGVVLGSSVHANAGTEDATAHRALTAEGAIVGTFQYMAPEQIEGRDADARSDIFSFGAVLYEMITGTRPFDARTKASLIASILDRDPRPISEVQPLVPPALERIVRTCLAKDPDERWQSAHDLMRELEWIRDGVSSPALEKAARRRASAAWVPWSVAALLAIVAGFATWKATAVRPAPRLVSAIAPPAGAAFVPTGDSAGPVTLSPDGRWAAFVAFSKTGPALWLQSLESGDVTLLRGTERAMFPFWSPDSRSIGYFAGGRLLVIEIDGSSPRVLADAPDARGGTWTPGGEILFTANTQDPIARVSANGGPVTRVTKLGRPYTTHRWPMVLPDGKRFLYLAANHGDPTGADTAMFVATLDGKQNHRLVAAAANGVPYRDYVLWVEANKLVARRLDGNALTGETLRIRDDVQRDPGTWRSIVSVSSGGLLVYHPSGASLGSPLIWMDREGKILSETPPRPIADIAISPDGEKMVASVGDPKGVIYIHDIARGVETRLSMVDEATRAPIWTRDGRHVIFLGVSPGKFNVYVKPADGSAPERLVHSSADEVRPSGVTPDGASVLADSPDGRVIAIPLAGGAPRTVIDTPAFDWGGRVSPDGRWLLYGSLDSGGRSVFIAPFSGSGGKWQVTNDTAYGAWWNPNGKEILYLTGDAVAAVDVAIEGSSVRLGAPRTLFPVAINTNNYSIDMTPDGRRFAVVAMQPSGSGTATLIANWDGALK